MNLLSLPNEMLASVFKYSTNKALLTVRSLNCRVDMIARKEKFHHFNLQLMRIVCYSSLNRAQLVSDSVEMEPFQQFYTIKNEREMKKLNDARFPLKERLTCQQLDIILSKVRKVKHLQLNRLTIDKQTVDTILKYKKIIRNCALRIEMCKMRISAEAVKNFANFAKLSETTISTSSFEGGSRLTDDIITGFNPSMRVVLSLVDAHLITSQSLYNRIYLNKLNLELIWTESSITFKDMLNFLKVFKITGEEIFLGTIQGVSSDIAEIRTISKSEFQNSIITWDYNEYSFAPYPERGVVRFRSTLKD